MNALKLSGGYMTTKLSIRHAWIELTLGCNLSCIHCYNESGSQHISGKPLTLQQYKKLLTDLYQGGCSSIQFIGGEPTLSKNFDELVAFAGGLHFGKLEVFSNLTHLSEKHVSLFAEHAVSLACSFYSYRAKVHDQVTKRRGSHKRTVAGICRVLSSDIPLRVGIIRIPGVNDDHIERTYKYLENLGVSNISIDDVRAFGRASSENREPNQLLSQLCGRCADESICVDPAGQIYPCVMSRHWAIGSIDEEGIDVISMSERWTDFRELLHGQRKEEISYIANCGPQDHCGPGACKPQMGGPPYCAPQTRCMPDLFMVTQ